MIYSWSRIFRFFGDFFDAFKASAENFGADDANKQVWLQNIVFKGTFYVELRFPQEVEMDDDALLYFSTAGSMNGFNDAAADYLIDTNREWVEEDGYNILKIELKTHSPEESSEELTYSCLAEYSSELLETIEYYMENLTITLDSYTSAQYYTISLNCTADIEIMAESTTLAKINCDCEQIEGGENNYTGVTEDEDISATMAFKITSTSGGTTTDSNF